MKRHKRSNVRLQNPNQSAETVASIVDILIQILLNLPIKPLIRFKSVSKHFLSLITSHQFSLLHNPSPNSAIGIFLSIKDYNNDNYLYQYPYISLYPNNSSVQPPFNLSFTTNPPYAVVLHSCNGLLLCGISDETVVDMLEDDPDRSMYVYNPTTNLYIRLPECNWDRCGASLVFDPVISFIYKVIMVVTKCSDYWIYVYSSESRVWSVGTKIGKEWRGGFKFENGVYWNGSVHWLTRKLLVKESNMSLRFHVATGVLEGMPSPPVVQDQMYSHVSNYFFGESCDHLHFVEHVLPRFNVYEMKRDYSEWFVKYKVDLSGFVREHPEVVKNGIDRRSLYVIYVLSLIRGESDEDSELVLRIPGKAVKVNLVDGTSDNLCNIRHNNICGSFGSSGDGGFSEKYYFQGECGLDYIQSLCSV